MEPSILIYARQYMEDGSELLLAAFRDAQQKTGSDEAGYAAAEIAYAQAHPEIEDSELVGVCVAAILGQAFISGAELPSPELYLNLLTGLPLLGKDLTWNGR